MSLQIKIINPSNSDQFYIIDTNFHNSCPYFLRTHDGQGMGFSPQQLFDSLDKWFLENM
jgi:hypothetical protein